VLAAKCLESTVSLDDGSDLQKFPHRSNAVTINNLSFFVVEISYVTYFNMNFVHYVNVLKWHFDLIAFNAPISAKPSLFVIEGQLNRLLMDSLFSSIIFIVLLSLIIRSWISLVRRLNQKWLFDLFCSFEMGSERHTSLCQKAQEIPLPQLLLLNAPIDWESHWSNEMYFTFGIIRNLTYFLNPNLT
jgi:hypothetical protein